MLLYSFLRVRQYACQEEEDDDDGEIIFSQQNN